MKKIALFLVIALMGLCVATSRAQSPTAKTTDPAKTTKTTDPSKTTKTTDPVKTTKTTDQGMVNK